MAQRAWLALVLLTLSHLVVAAERDLLAERTQPWPDGWRLAGGRLAVTARGDSRRAVVVELPQATSGSARLTWRVTQGADLRIGLVCMTGPDSGWYAQMRGDGYYWIGQVTAGRAQARLTGLVPAERPGEPLSLRLEWQAGRQTTWLCGTPLSLPATSIPVSGVALWAAGQGAAEVMSLGLVEPAVATTPPTHPVTPNPPVTPTTPPRLSPGGNQEPDPSAPTDGGAQPGNVGQGQPGTPLPGGNPTRPSGTEPPGATVVDPGSGHPGGALPAPTRPGGPDVPTPPQPGGVAVPTAPGGAAVLFEDDFDPPKHRWNRDAYREVQQGGLRLRAETGYQLSGFPDDFGALSVSARVRSLSADGGTYGLVARLQSDGGSGYLFVVRDPDQWAIARLDRGTAVVLKRGNTALAAGEHRLTATCVGEELAFAVDGTVLGQVADTTYPTGGVGVWVDNQRAALFDDLLAVEAVKADLTTPPVGVPTIPGATTPANGVLPFEERFAAPRMSWQQDGQRELRDGALWLTSEPARYVVSGVAEQRYTDYLLTAECEPVTGPEEGRFGLMARLQADGSSGYLLAVRPDGGFVVMRMEPNGAEMLSHGALALPRGTQRLWARCAGTSLIFGINQTELARVQDGAYGTGGFGVYADNGAQARFLTLRAEALP